MKVSKFRCIVGLLLFFVPSAWPVEPVKVTVRFYDQAHVDPGLRRRAQVLTTHIFHNAGIAIQWLDNCPADRPAFHPDCDGQDATSVRVLVFEHPPDDWHPLVCGLRNREDRFIAISFHRVMETAAILAAQNHDPDLRHFEAVVLGTVLAHELGHDLLDNGKHSRTGIMKQRLTYYEWRFAAGGVLLFSNDEAAAMRAQFASRRSN